MKHIDLIKEATAYPNRPNYKLDLDNKVYIVYDAAGNEVGRHTFQHVWDSSPAKRAAEKSVSDLSNKDYEEKKKHAATAPLNDYEKEYIRLKDENKVYYDMLFPGKGRGYNPKFTPDAIATIEQEMEKNYKRMEQLNNSTLNRIRQSVVLDTYSTA